MDWTCGTCGRRESVYWLRYGPDEAGFNSKQGSWFMSSPKRPDLPSLVFNGVLSSKVKQPEREAAQLLCFPYISSWRADGQLLFCLYVSWLTVWCPKCELLLPGAVKPSRPRSLNTYASQHNSTVGEVAACCRRPVAVVTHLVWRHM